jgi:hypothetical protein
MNGARETQSVDKASPSVKEQKILRGPLKQ